MVFKKIIRNIHLYLGLISGVIVFIVSVTGCMYVFKEEIESFSDDYKKVASQNMAMIPPSKAISITEELMPNIEIHGVVYRRAEDAIEVILYQAEPMYYGAIYLNPYSGELIKSKDFIKSFWGFALHGHKSLWLPLKIGMPIVAIGIIIFIILLISGLVLWWPKASSFKNSLRLIKKPSQGIKPLDLHKVLGFYIFIFALIISLTGISWLVPQVAKAIYASFGGEMEVKYKALPSDISNKPFGQDSNPVDLVWERIRNTYPDSPFLEIHTIHDETSSILVEHNRSPCTHWKMDYIFFDQYTLQEIVPDHIYGRYELAGLPEKVRRMNYDIHTGNIWGLPGKIFAFLISLVCASLPITGYMMWISRKKQQKKLLKEFDLD